MRTDRCDKIAVGCSEVATQVIEESLVLDGMSAVVPRARGFVAATLAGLADEHLLHDAQLVATELVTNAVLHGAPPLVLTVSVADDVTRISVTDAGRAQPVPGIGRPDTMTGRGLTLVNVLARAWGVDPADGGKTVWAELTSGHPADPGAVAAHVAPPCSASAEAESGEPRFRIELGDVPTELLLGAKAHVDNLLREFALTEVGAASGTTASVPPHLSSLIEMVTDRFAEARQSIKQQAVAAWHRGEDRTSLVLHLPLSAADAGQDYLGALDEADAYARAARLLTLESPPQHRVFRRWYVEEIVGQLRRAARGEPVGVGQTFEQRLLAELGTVAAAQRATDRAARLQEVTAALAAATSPEQVAQVVVSHGVAALGAFGGGLLIPGPGEQLAVPGAVGYEDNVVEELRSERRDAGLPAAEALRTGEPVWLESPQERDSRFPALRGLEPTTVSMCALPLCAGDQVLGALRFSFDAPRLFDEDERRFALALAAQTAQALDRCRLYDAERQARDAAERSATRLLRLQQVTADLVGVGSVSDVAHVVVGHAAGSLGGRLAALSILEDPDTLAVAHMLGAQPASVARWQTYPVSAHLPASIALRTRQPFIARSLAELRERFPDLETIGEQALVCVPLLLRDEVLGVLSVSFPGDYDVDQADVELLETIARQCALAISRVRLFEAERAGRERAAFLADATSALTSSLEPKATAAHVVNLVVPRLADWAVVYLLDPLHNQPTPSALKHRDPSVTARAVANFDAHRLEGDAGGGVAEVLRTGQAIRYSEVPEAVRQRVFDRATHEDREAFLPTVGLIVPLIARSQLAGALALARTNGPAYTDDDVRLVEDLAARAAVAVSHAQQFARERDAALTLQHSLLPRTLPSIAGLTFAWRYFPGATGTYVGGDWYDVIPLEPTGRVALVIGDVMGHGVQAAAVMGQLRATARAYATTHVSPVEVLSRLDAAVGQLEQAQITTVLYGVLEPATGRLTLASAGHLPPLLVTATDAAFLDIDPAPPLGAGAMSFQEHTITLPTGATLLLFTDGLVEDHDRPLDDGMQALRAAVRGVTDPEELCDRALRALGRDSGHDDDTAMLAVHRQAVPDGGKEAV